MIRQHVLVACLVLLAVSVGAADPTCYVANTLGQTLSKINLNTGVVTNDIVPLGSDLNAAPNQVVVRGTLAYVVNSNTAEIQIIDLTTESTLGFIDLPPGSNPFHMAFYDERYAYVTLLVANEIAKVDVETRQVLWREPIGLAPGPIVIANHKAYVGITAVDTLFVYHRGELAIWDCQGDTLLQIDSVRTNPNALAVDNDNRVHVSCAGDFFSEFCWVYVYDSGSDTVVDSVFLGGSPSAMSITPNDVAYMAAGGWVTTGEMYAYNAEDLTIYNDATNPAVAPRGCIGIATYQDNAAYPIGFHDTLAVTDTSGIVQNRFPVGDGPVWADFNYQPGDLDGNWQVTLGDLTLLIDLLFITLENPPVAWRANVSGDLSVSLGDLTVMVDYLFINPGETTLHVSPRWVN
ncbi:hypothetical protein GF377_10600 [candidate division GN15 bacterium]|nr:hypothetical protein [candidate division GN15 bacterium]